MWIYYYASFGPGHQSHDYGFKLFYDGCDMEDIEEHLFNMLRDHDSVILNFWKVKKVHATHINSEIKYTREKIENCKKYLKILEGRKCFIPDEKDGEDPVIKKNLRSKVDSDVLRRLHKAGFMYDSSDISNWWYGKKSPVEPDRSKILRIIRRAKSYPKH